MLVAFQAALNVEEAIDVKWFHPLESSFVSPHVKLTMVDARKMNV